MEQIARLVEGLGAGTSRMYGLGVQRWAVSLPALILPAVVSYVLWGVMGSGKPMLRTVQTCALLYSIALSAAIIYMR